MHFEQNYYVSIIKKHFPEGFAEVAVLEVGSYDVNGSIREFFANCEYIGLDLMPGPGVDVVVSSGHEYDTYKRFDTVLSCECFEHNPYYFETFEKMVSLACGGGLVIFTCATEGRPEHGTSRTSPDQSPGTVSSGWEYYRNLTGDDFSAFDFKRNFAGYRFMANPGSQDLYFVGVKYPAPENFEARLNQIVEEVDQLTKASMQFVASDALFKAGDPSAAAEGLGGVAPFVHADLEAYVRYRQAWYLMSAKRYQEAEVVIKRLLSLGDRAEFHFQRSQFLHETGKPEAAIVAARAAIAREQTNADYWEHLANLLLNSGDAEGAESAFLEASRLTPLDVSRKDRIKTLGFQQRPVGSAALGSAPSTYAISFSPIDSPGFDQVIKLWNLESPAAGKLEAGAGGELSITGWVLPHDELNEVSLLIRVGPSIEVHELNVGRPDVVSAILQRTSEETTLNEKPRNKPRGIKSESGRINHRKRREIRPEGIKCGFSVTVPVHEAIFRLGFRVGVKDYWAREVRLAHQPQVLSGKDHWEFLADSGNGILDQHNNHPTLSDTNVRAWLEKIAGSKIKLKVPFSILVAPHKATVYPDYLPAGAALNYQRSVYDLLAQEPDVVYPLERMISSSFRHPTYSKAVALWSPYGAYVAYRALTDKLGYVGLNRKVIEESRVVWGEEGVEPVFERKAELSFHNGLIGPGQIRLYKNAEHRLPKVMLFCDAFGMTHFDSFLAESCSELLCIYSPELDVDAVNAFSPDFVVTQYSEAELAHPLGEASTVYQIIKSGIENAIYPAAMLELFVSSGNNLNGILNGKKMAELTLEAQKALV